MGRRRLPAKLGVAVGLLVITWAAIAWQSATEDPAATAGCRVGSLAVGHVEGISQASAPLGRQDSITEVSPQAFVPDAGWVKSRSAARSPCSPALVATAAAPTTTHVGSTAVVTFTVRNRGGQLARGVRLTLRGPHSLPTAVTSSNCLLSKKGCELDPGAALAVRVALTPKTAQTAELVGLASTTSRDADLSHASAKVRITVKRPRASLNSYTGPPGFVASVHGVDFPPGAKVGLTWLPGLTAQQEPVTVRADGTFDTHMLVLRSDRPGPRDLAVSPVAGPAFSRAIAAFLVVPHALEAPKFLDR
ncbi:hypothetical protein FBY35_5658 [Streptomyces sp. SLBN-118]|nr:hypothetical protein FBY35_5658 [Streptomyces sp. SLBN-118]